MSARFKVLGETFVVTKRFLVLPGMIVAGIVKPGMTMTIPSFPRVLTIHSVEYLDRIDTHTSHLGLTFQYVNQDEIDLWKALHLQNQILDIQDSVT